MPRNSFNYSQLGIGDCGHVVHTWPQVCDLGGRNPQVVCEDCTRERMGVDVADEFMVWVPLREKPTPVTPKKSLPKKPKRLSPWQELLQQEGLL